MTSITSGSASAPYRVWIRVKPPTNTVTPNAHQTQGAHHDAVSPSTQLMVGNHVIEYEFIPDAAKPGTGGKCLLLVDGKQVAQGQIPKTVPFAFPADEGADVGLTPKPLYAYEQGNNNFTEPS
ncbi:MAG: hypothetical protein ACR2JB_25495 [Bryobacteraceae bacterium]